MDSAGDAWACRCSLLLLVPFVTWMSGCAPLPPTVRLSEWERGIKVESLGQPAMAMYLWFYEWHMFDAVEPGQHTAGGFKQFTHHFRDDGTEAELRSDGMVLTARAVRDGAELELTITNRSDHDWPDVAGIIPCFNPGPPEVRNPEMANTRTYFVSADGLVRQVKREIHFNAGLRGQVDARSEQGTFVFSEKWPTSPVDAAAGLLLRESNDGEWVTGIAWDRFLSAQGHNPWECMHLGVLVGPLKRGETRTLRGRIYLLRGDRRTGLARYWKDFARGE